jgi:transcriptional regulator with XRE-family HTH domain
MTFVATEVNTNVVGRRVIITGVVDPHDQLVALIRSLMRDGLSQQAISDATRGEVSQSAISTYLSGARRAKLETALAVGKAFGKPASYFTGEVAVERDDELGAPAVEAFIERHASAGTPIAEDAARALRRTFYKTAEITDDLVAHAYGSWVARQAGKAIDRPSVGGKIDEARGQRKLEPVKKRR